VTYSVITGRLVARTAVHVGSGEGTGTTDALIRRDAAGNALIPGTAIAGALRALLTRLAPRLGSPVCHVMTGASTPCDCAVCRLFGDANPSDEGDTLSQASHILVFNAKLDGSSGTVIRDGVGINRATGTAARAGAVKFDLEVLPAGAAFDLRIELRGTSPEDEQLLAVALAEWCAGRAWLGGRVARGLGAFSLRELSYAARDLDEPSELMAFLCAPEPWVAARQVPGWLNARLDEARAQPVAAAGDDHPSVVRCWVSFEGTLQAEGLLLSSDATVAGKAGFDNAPLLAQVGDWDHPLLSGAGLRGAIRSHAERIARTLATLQAQDGAAFRQACPACDPTARRLRKDVPSSELPPLESCDSLLLYEVGKSGNDPVEAEQMCLACQLFGSPRFGSRLVVEDAPYAGSAPPAYKMVDFLAIDRFTGGGADKRKFDALALWKPAFTLRLHLDNPQPWELGWLALVFRDLAEGWLSLGYGAAKGFGSISLAGWSISYGYLSPEDVPMLEVMPAPQQDGIYTVIAGDSSQAALWQDVAETWVQAFRVKVIGDGQQRGFTRVEKMIPRHDSYFRPLHGRWLNELYPKEVNLP
jgi:CRISPR/Cas system CSM-associated protein Csm3 (group 7 of RAMP superfamily)